MNPEQILNMVEDVILHRKSSPTDKWNLIWIEHTVQCVPCNETTREMIILKTLNYTEVTYGLTPSGWRRLNAGIEKQMKREM